ncbi:MAG: leucyl aminopeptidase family protein [Planctomycetota bacterium]
MYKSIRAGRGKDPLIIVAIHADQKQLPRSLPLSTATRRVVQAARQQPGFRADAGELARADDRHLLLGLGKRAELKAETLRTIGGRLVRGLDRREVSRARLELAAIDARRVGHDVAGRCLGEGIGLANWRVDFFTGAATRQEPARAGLTVGASDDEIHDGLKRGLLLAESTNYARRLAATPPNICNPPWLASESRAMARRTGLGCRVITAAQAEAQGMGGLVNVGRGSVAKPCMIILEHKPSRPVRGRTLVLVGKSITYDTGGYSLKINNSMKGMKYDKCGGMAVLGAMHAIASLKLPVRVFGLLAAAENMVAGDSYRPDDIITMYNGVSVEVTNTDAEGRLVLADALAYACKKLKPTALIDAATLTGGVVVALGGWCAGSWCNDDSLQRRLDDAASASGERLWPLPLWPEHRDFMRARHADVWNSAPKRDAHPIQGAAFLSYFVDEDVPWAHLDIAGVASVDADSDLFVQGPTGYGVRLLTDLASDYAG